MPLLFSYLAGVIVLVAADLLWLGVLMKPFYFERLGHLLAPTFYIPAALAFYLIYPLGLMLFVVQPQLANGLPQVTIMSALYGFFAYALYDLTNHATLQNWPLSLTLVDITWGAALTAAIGSTIYLTQTYLLAR